ncbi:MAG: pimeloyl-ACP methyl esterase BioG family protein [Candidatus Electronema sp. VV]
MNSYWLRRGNSGDCLLFLSGWGMGPEPFADVNFGLADVLLVYDYRSMDSGRLFSLLPEGGRLHLLAWSMGVWAAAWLARHDPLFAGLCFSSATALGGTLSPVDDRCGIPAGNFAAMLDNFSPAALEQFRRSMFDGEEEAERFLRCPPRRSPAELREELEQLHTLCQNSAELLPDIYSRRIVTARDRVFPARSQIRAWGRERCETLPLPHFPFYQQAGLKALRPPLLKPPAGR